MPRWILLGFIVGILAGFFAFAFFYLLELAKFVSFDYLAGHPIPNPAGEQIITFEVEGHSRKWLYFLLPAVGGLLSGVVVYFLAPEAKGDGTDAMIEAFHHKQGKVRNRVPLVKSLSSLITLATGGSAGREGPISQIGGGLGSWVGNLLKLNARDRRFLLIAGAGGALGAIFRAPLGCAIVAMEFLYKEDLEVDALIPTVISSITAYTVFSEVLIRVSGMEGPIFQIPSHLSLTDPRELLFYVGLGLVCVPLGLFYIRVFYGLRHKVFEPMPIPDYLKPMIGGFAVGLIGLYVPQVYCSGWGHIQTILMGRLDLIPIKIMALIVVFKILATSFTLSSGGSGGLLAPTFVIGGMIGGVVGYYSHLFFPHIVPEWRSFVLVGMAAFFAGVANAPLGAMFIVTEMTGNYKLIEPLLLVSVIAIIFNRRYSIYMAQVKNKFHSPAHIGEFTVNVLEDMYVKSVYRPKKKMPTIPANAGLSQVQDFLAMEEEEIFPVVKQDGTILGLLSLDTSRPILFEEGVDQFLIAEDLAIPAGDVHPGDSLYQALVEFLKYPISGILVTDPDNNNKVLGVLHHRDLIRAYNNEIIKRKQP